MYTHISRYLVGLSGLLLCASISEAQTSVDRYDVSSMPDNSVVYSLPLTRVAVTIQVKRVEEAPGQFYIYAPKYLGVSEVISEPSVRYELESADISTYGVADTDNKFAVKFKTGTTAPFVYLTPDGILCAINAEYVTEDTSAEQPAEKGSAPDTSRRLPSMSAEYVQATTDAKRAEIAAREIYRVRESRVNIVSGDAEQPFPDGQAMKLAMEGLDRQEKLLTEMFLGSRDVAVSRKVVRNLMPDSTSTVVAFRMSDAEGLLPADDLRGEPVYMKTEVLEKAPELSERDAARKARRMKGVVYNVPGKARVSLLFRGKVIADNVVEVAQLGTQEALEPNNFNTRRGTISVTFYPATGAIKSVKGQE